MVWNFVKNALVAMAFETKILIARVKNLVGSLFRPRVGALDHITIPVKDLAVARWFYSDLLGATHFMTVDDAALERFGRPASDRRGQGSHHISVYVAGETRLDLFLQDTGQPSERIGHPHYAFKVSSFDLLKWKRILESRGIPTDGPMRLGPPGQASLYFNDPFGNHLEVTCLGYIHDIPIRAPKMSSLEWSAGVTA